MPPQLISFSSFRLTREVIETRKTRSPKADPGSITKSRVVFKDNFPGSIRDSERMTGYSEVFVPAGRARSALGWQFCEGASRERKRASFRSDGCDTIGSFCGAVDGFDEGDAAAAFEAVAGGGTVVLDGLEKIFEDGLVTTEIADDGGRGALVFVEGGGFGGGGWGVPEISGDDAVVLENDGAFRAGDFDAARIAGISGGGSVENAQGAAGEFEDGDGGVFGFDLVKLSGGAGLNANDITEQPEEQIDSVNALIDQGAAAVERQSAAPARIGIILWRAIPLHAGVDE